MLTLIFSLVGVFFLVAFLATAMAIYRYASLFPRISKMTGDLLLALSLILAAILVGSNHGGLYGILGNLFFGGGAVILGVWGAAFRTGSRAGMKQA